MPEGNRVRSLERVQLQRGRWEAKLVARLLAKLLIQTSVKNNNVRQKQQSGQHTLARQKEKITEQSVSKLRKICTIYTGYAYL